MVHKTPNSVEDFCGTCGIVLDTDEESLHYDCGGDCLWCMAKAGDPDCQARFIDMMRRDCIKEMNAVYDEFERLVGEVDGDTEEFAMRILEQWRPWI